MNAGISLALGFSIGILIYSAEYVIETFEFVKKKFNDYTLGVLK